MEPANVPPLCLVPASHEATSCHADSCPHLTPRPVQDIEYYEAERARKEKIRLKKSAKELKDAKDAARRLAEEEFKTKLSSSSRFQQMLAEREEVCLHARVCVEARVCGVRLWGPRG
jgi:hypothetical protein